MNTALARQAKQQSYELNKLMNDHTIKLNQMREFHAKENEFDTSLDHWEMYTVLADEAKQRCYELHELMNEQNILLGKMLQRHAEEKTRLINSFQKKTRGVFRFRYSQTSFQ